MRRTDRLQRQPPVWKQVIRGVVFAALVIIVPAGIVAGLTTWRVHQLVKYTLKDVQSQTRHEYRRPTLQAALAGTFADLLEPQLPALCAAQDQWLKDPNPNRAQRARAAAERSVKLVDRVLAVTNAGLGGASRRSGDVSCQSCGPKECTQGWNALTFVAMAARIQALEQLDAGHAEVAVQKCLAGLTLVREAMTGTGNGGASLGISIEAQLLPGCWSVADQSPLDEKKAFENGLATLVASFPTIRDVARSERVFQEVTLSQAFFSEKDRVQLPASAVAMMSHERPLPYLPLDSTVRSEYGTWAFLAKVLTVPPMVAIQNDAYDDLAQLADRPVPEQRQAVRDFEHSHERDADRIWWNPLHFSPGRFYTAGIHDLLRARDNLAVLLEATRLDIYQTEHHSWPTEPLAPDTKALIRLEPAGADLHLVPASGWGYPTPDFIIHPDELVVRTAELPAH